MKIAFIRGPYLNNFELQSYYPMLKDGSIQMTGFASRKPMHQVRIQTKKLWSPVDLPNFPYKLPILNRILADAMYLYGLERALRGSDIAHVRETYFHFTKQAILARQKGYIKKVLVTCSETIPFNHETIWGRHQLKQFVIKNADHFHCLSQKAKKALIAEGVSEDKITVISYGVDLNHFKSVQTKPKSKVVKALFIGRLEEQKGVFELVQVWQKIRKNHPFTQLEVLGSGPLEKYIKRHGVIPKKIPYQQIVKHMQQVDLLILPSKPTKYWEEYLGMVLLESMATGLPIVTTSCGAIPEVVGDAALMVKPGDSEQLYKTWRQMIEDISLRNKLSQKGLKRAKTHFDANKQAEKLKKLYQTILGAPRHK
ncbi:glycosyltransferase family 4 protein [Candidatus Beckwithbacteria bacterium]|nr:glycosyltransferase family 4 protein [Candidatus Beckwithbacteria bacterium]